MHEDDGERHDAPKWHLGKPYHSQVPALCERLRPLNWHGHRWPVMKSLAHLLLYLTFIFPAFGSDQKPLAENAKLSNDSLLWGPYRPNLYFGIRPRIPKSFSGNLLWAHVGDFQAVQNSLPHFSATSSALMASRLPVYVRAK